MARYQFWFHETGSDGEPVDENVLRTAAELAPVLAHYRQQEMDCESTANEILQSAVEAVSRAIRKNPVANLPGYLTAAYKRLVNKRLERENRLVPTEDQFLEDLLHDGNNASFDERLHRRLALEQVLRAMDPETRKICILRLEGYSEAEIAKRLGTTANAVSVRFTRGLKKAAKTVLQGTRSFKRT